MFVPKDFNPPQLRTETYIARQLMAKDAELDLEAVLSSMDIIHDTRGGSWPKSGLTLEDNRSALSWHQKEFEYNSCFAYTIMNLDEIECLGCIYFYHPENGMLDGERAKKEGAEVEISWWVTQKMYDQGFYDTLSHDIKAWVEAEWPFKKVLWANMVLPEGFDV